MIKKSILVLCLLVFIAPICNAKDSISGIDGNTLLKAFRDKESIEAQMLCSSYIASFKDTVVALNLAYKSAGLDIPPLYCLPEKGISQKELMRLIEISIQDMIKKDPTVGKVNAATLILNILFRKYPCKYE